MDLPRVKQYKRPQRLIDQDRGAVKAARKRTRKRKGLGSMEQKGGGGKVKKKRTRRSRSKRATEEAARRQAALAAAVQMGDAPMPKRNTLAWVDVNKLKLKKLGPFWYSRNIYSPCYITLLQYHILKRIASFFNDPEQLGEFKVRRSKEASGVSLRVIDNFYTNHCKVNRIIIEDQEGFFLDVQEDYNAMLAKYNKAQFDDFCRGVQCILFETPEHLKHLDKVVVKPVKKPKKRGRKPKSECDTFNDAGYGDFVLGDEDDVVPPKGKEGEGEGEGKSEEVEGVEEVEDKPPVPPGPDSDVRKFNCTTLAQTHFFFWLLNNRHYRLIVKRSNLIHARMSSVQKRNQQLKDDMECPKRQELSRERQVSHVIQQETEMKIM